MRTLYDLSDLKESRFGRPPPRHGLILLWWFAHECVLIDSNDCMIAQCDPENGAFGFHRFYNRERLLPYSNLPYYEVGNLHTTGSLPQYVTQYYTGYIDNSNTDRVIVLFNSRWNRFDSVYVTQHSDLVKFDQNHTYCISIKLMKDIKDLSREGFLKEPILPKRPTPPEHCSIDMTNIVMSNAQPKQPTPPEQCSIDMTNNVMPNAQAKRPNPPEYLAIDIINGGHSQARPVITVTCTSQAVQSKTCLSKKCYYVLICVLILLLFIIAAIVFLLYKMK